MEHQDCGSCGDCKGCKHYKDCKYDCRCYEDPCKKKREPYRFYTALTGSQEVPPVETTGLGSGKVLISRSGKSLRFKFCVKDLTSPLEEPVQGLGFAHFHLAKAGQNGPIIFNISDRFKLSSDKKSGYAEGKWTVCSDHPLKPEYIDAFRDGSVYVNLHTEAHPGGEVRGQIAEFKLKKGSC